jgi:hypothetical protein
MATIPSSTQSLELAVKFLGSLGDSGHQVLEHGLSMSREDAASYYEDTIRHFYLLRPEWPLYRQLPVDPRTFVESAYFLNQAREIYPGVMREFVALNTGDYVEAVLSGGIGVAKTTIALLTTAYQLYVLSCMVDPHATFGLQPSSEIVFVFQSITRALAKSVDYERFQGMISAAPYFQQRYPFAKEPKAEMRFPRRVVIKPLSGSVHAAIGQNIFGGVIDEINFMPVVQDSKQSVDGGVFDQGAAIYDSIVRRRKSRFLQRGKLPGMLCLVSSNR